MPRRMVFAVRYLTFDINPVHHEILGEHIFNVGVNLAYGIYIFHHTSFASIPFTKEDESSVP